MDKVIVATHQPNYIPWLGYFYKISKCTDFVFLDDVQFSKTGSHNYHRIKTSEGLLKLKIPVKHKFTDPINKVVTNDAGGWENRHLSLIEAHYKDAPYFDEVYSNFEIILNKNHANLADLNIELIHFFMDKFKISTNTILSSSLDISSEIRGESRILMICELLNANAYYSGSGAKAYQNESNFENLGIELIYDDFKPVEYNQLWGEFMANVSILDYVMNYGFDWTFIFSLISAKVNQI